MSSAAPYLGFTANPLTGPDFSIEKTEAFGMLLDEALAGGAGTRNYLQHMLKFASLSSYLNNKGPGAFVLSAGPGGGQQATATDGTSTMTVGLVLGPLAEQPAGAAPPVRGVATVRLALPHPFDVVQIAQFAVTLAELSPGTVLNRQVWQALARPLLTRLTAFLRDVIGRWLATDVGEDVAGLTSALDGVTAEAAEAGAEETAEVIVEGEVVAEVAIDLAAAVPALAGLAVLLVIPMIITALAKRFVLHIEVDNVTDVDFTWSIPYVEEGAVTVRPASSVLPKMAEVTDSWGDTTTVPVVFQGTFSSMNTSGYAGIGLVINLSPAGFTGQDTCALISIPWIADNAIWLGGPGRAPDWAAFYAANSGANGRLRVSHGNQRFTTALSIDALSGASDEYHCVIRIERL
jgi:hypothetical protein